MKYRKTVIITTVVILLVFAGLLFFREYIATQYIAHQLRSEKSISGELEVSRRLNRWVGVWVNSYQVEFLDAKGRQLNASDKELFSKTHTITIFWENGVRAKRRLLSKESLVYIMGE